MKPITATGKAGGLARAIGLVGVPLAAGAASIALLALTGDAEELNTEGDKIKDRLMNVSIELDEQSKADFDAKVSEYTANSRQVMAIELKVDAEKTDIEGELELAIADGKLTKGETNKLRNLSTRGWTTP